MSLSGPLDRPAASERRSSMALTSPAVWLPLLAFCAGGLALRLMDFHRSMWEDEITSAYYAQIGIKNVISTLTQNGSHPPLYFMLVASDARFGLDPVTAIRLPSLVAGVLTIPVVYLLAYRLAGRQAALVAGALVAVAPIAIWYSDEGRMYALVWFLVLLSYLFLAWADRSRWWLLFLLPYTVITGLALWTDYSAALALIPQPALIFFMRRRGWFLAGWAVAWISLTPWFVYLREQYGRIQAQAFPGESWAGALMDLAWLRASYASLGDTLPHVAAVTLLVLLGASAVVAFVAILRTGNRLGVVGLCLTAGAAAVALGLALQGTQAVIVPRVMGVITFGFVFLVACAASAALLSRFRATRVAAAVCVAAVMGGVAASAVDVARNGSNGVHWAGVARTIQNDAQAGDELIYYPVGAKFAVDPYLPQSSRWRTQFNGSWPKDQATIEQDLQAWTAGKQRVWFVFYAIGGTDAQKSDDWFSQHRLCRVMGDPSRSMGVIEYEASAAPC